jgi:hypothetical protein
MREIAAAEQDTVRSDMTVVSVDVIRRHFEKAAPYASHLLKRSKYVDIKPYELVLAHASVMISLCKAYKFPARDTVVMIEQLMDGREG